MPSALLADPSRTTTLRRQWISELQSRFRNLNANLFKLFVVQDSFGLDLSLPKLKVNTRFAFISKPNKLKIFKKWISEQVAEGRFSAAAAKYIRSAYQQGLTRAYVEIRRKDAADAPLDFLLSNRERFRQITMGQALTASKLEVLYTRAFESLDGVTSQMSAQMSRILADGLLRNHKPKTIAREMARQLDISLTRALLITRTELVHAQAEGMLDAYERLGIDEVGLIVEFTTAGDDKVCKQCLEHSGNTYTVEEAHGLIPLHPQCRCTWSASIPSTRRNRRRNKAA